MTDGAKPADEKPELLYADLHKGRSFRPLAYPITKTLVAEFMDTTGDGSPLYAGDAQVAPPGLVAIYARASYLQDHVMPSGGILAKQEFEFHHTARIGDTLTVRAEVVENYLDNKGRKRVNFLIRADTQDGKQVSTTRLHAIWPK